MTERSPVTLGKLIILLLGIAILGVGLESHFNSAWVEETQTTQGNMSFYKVCKDAVFKEVIKAAGEHCPSIAMERYFVSVIIICSIVSLVSLPLAIKFDLGKYPFKFVDAGVHGLCAVMLVIAGSLHVVSAVQIDGLLSALKMKGHPSNFKYVEKIIAGALVLVQSLLYTMVAFLIIKMNRLR